MSASPNLRPAQAVRGLRPAAEWVYAALHMLLTVDKVMERLLSVQMRQASLESAMVEARLRLPSVTAYPVHSRVIAS